MGTFENINVWLKELCAHANRDIVLILVGNKTDMLGEKKKRAVSEDEAQRFANEQKVPWMETSAKTGERVDESFEKVVKTIYEYAFLERPRPTDNGDTVEVDENNTSGKCCG